MKIFLCKGQFMGPISGADETLVAYASQLRLAGHEPSVLLIYPHARDDQYYVRLRDAGVPVRSIASSRVGASMTKGRRVATGLLRALPSSQRLVRKQTQRISTGINNRYLRACREYFERCGADLLHVMTPDPSAMVLIRAGHEAGLPVLYHELGTPYHPPAFEAYYEQFTSVLPLCSEVAALSPRLLTECREKLPGVTSLSLLPVMTEAALNGHKHYQRHGHDVTFGFAARLEALKAPLVLIEAFIELRRKQQHVRLRIAGDGTQREDAMALARAGAAASRCELLGTYTDIKHKSEFMRSLDVFVLPSLTEGTPNGIAEAMAHGVPIIASDVGGIPDMITPETGILVPPQNPKALADAMIRLAADPELRARMGRAARERYERLFSPDAVLPLMLDIYHRVAAGNGISAKEGQPGGHDHLHPWSVKYDQVGVAVGN